MADLSPPVPPPTPEEATNCWCPPSHRHNGGGGGCSCCFRAKRAVPPSEAPAEVCGECGEVMPIETGIEDGHVCSSPAPAPTAAEGRSAVEVLVEAKFERLLMEGRPADMVEGLTKNGNADLAALRTACGDSGWTVIGPDGRLYEMEEPLDRNGVLIASVSPVEGGER